MKNFLFSAIAFFVIHMISAQKLIQNSGDNIYNTAGIEVIPEYPGGIEKFYQLYESGYAQQLKELIWKSK